MAALPGLAWIVYAADYLFSSRAASWIGPPDYALLEETLARGLGLWPLPKLGLILLLLVVSFVKPMAYSRYFVVLVPAVLPVLAVQFGALNLNRLGRAALGFGALAGQQWTFTGQGAQAPTLAITSFAGGLPL